MRIVVVSQAVAGSSPTAVVDAAVQAWRAVRPDDEVIGRPVSDGGVGLVDTVARTQDAVHHTEVAGPFGHPLTVTWVLRPDATAVLEAAQVCGDAAAAAAPGDRAGQVWWGTSYGVGQLLDAARRHGARRLLLGVGGVAVGDLGVGALAGLGMRVLTGDGGGLKIGGEDLHRLARITDGWEGPWEGHDVVVLADVAETCAHVVDAERRGDGSALAEARGHAVSVLERDLAGPGTADERFTGAGGGLALGVRAALGAELAPGAAVIADVVGLAVELARAEAVLVVADTPSGQTPAATDPTVADLVAAAAPRLEALHVTVDAAASGGDVTAAVEAGVHPVAREV